MDYELNYRNKKVYYNLYFLGNDLLLVIHGGDLSHIGGYSTAYCVEDKWSIESSALPHHKDEVLAQMYAEPIAKQLQCSVHCVCGVHYDDLSKDELIVFIDENKNLLKKILKDLEVQHGR
jgi:hypothetical protein